MRRLTALAALLSISLLLCGIGLAQEEKPRSLEAIEFFTGFGWGKLRHQGNYRLIPFMVDFDFNLKPLARKINFNPKSLLQLQLEPFLSFVSSPDNNIETGASFLLKMGLLPQTFKFQPFILGGVGLVYMTQHTRTQSTQFNFTEQAGLGLHYFFRKDTALTIEGRIRHLSNADIKRPNTGINTYFVFTGISYLF